MKSYSTHIFKEMNNCQIKAHFHLPGLYEFYELYKRFLPIYKTHSEYFYIRSDIASIYGAPDGCIWGGGRTGEAGQNTSEVLALLKEYGISPCLTFSNSLINEFHLSDEKCNRICEQFAKNGNSGVIVHSDLLLDYLSAKYPSLYFVSSTTKVITDFECLKSELNRSAFRYVVPDFRFNNSFDKLNTLNNAQKQKCEFLCNECCYIGCKNRKLCYENVSRRNLGQEISEFECKAPGGNEGYRFSKAMESPAFISNADIVNHYLPNGFSHFKIEGRGLGSAMILEFLLYYLVKPEYQLKVREEIYLDSMLDLF